MEFDPDDQEIIRLLAKLSDAEGEYPKHMLEARRQSFLRHMGQIGLGIGADQGIQNAIKDVAPSGAPPAVSTLLETALVVAILAEAGTVAYFYRDELADFFRKAGIEPRVQELTPAPADTTSLEIQGVTPSTALPSTVPSATILTTPAPTGIAATSTGTPFPGLMADDQNNTGTATGGANVLDSTPAPNSNNTNNGNNGHHYGQTPKPERTKENGNNPAPRENNGNPPRENPNPPPRENNGNPPRENPNPPPRENNGNPPNENNNRRENNNRPPPP